MKGERVRRQAPFLRKVLNEANANKRKELLRIADADKINAVSEFVLNTLRGNVPQSRYTVSLLRPHARTLRAMGDAKKEHLTHPSMTPTGLGMGGSVDDVDETLMKKMVDRIIKETTPARRQGVPLAHPPPVKRKLKMPHPTPLPPELSLFTKTKTLPKASTAVTRSKSKKQKKLGHSFKSSVKEGAKREVKKGVEKALKRWLDFPGT